VTQFQIHTIESAPEKSKAPLQGLQSKFGFIPNVAATMAGSPALINAFIGGFSAFHGGSFNEREKQIVLLTDAVVIGSPWTVAFHSTMALEAGVPAADVEAVRQGCLPANPQYAALSAMAKALIEKRGRVSDAEIEAFASAGYSETQILEVINAIGISTMAALAGNLAGTPVEDRLAAQVWAAA